MALIASRVVVGTAAGGTLVATNSQSWTDGGGRRITQRYLLAAGTSTSGTYCFGGGTDVTMATGFPLVLTAGAAPTTLDLEPGESLYVIGAASGTFAVLQRGT